MRIAAAVSMTLLFAAGAAAADDLSDLRERLEAQEQKIRVLERKLELQDEATKAAVPTTPVVRASPQQGFRIQSADGANVAAPARRAAFRRPLFPGRHHARDRGHVDPPPRAADARRHAQRHLRLPLHAGLRRRPHLHPRRVRRGAAQALGGRHRRQVQGAGRPRAPASRRPTCASSSAGSRPAWCRIATSACSSAATSPAALVNYSVGYFNGVSDGGSSDEHADAGRRERHEGRLGGARVLPAVRQLRQLRAARTRLRRRRHVRRLDRQHRRRRCCPLSHAGPADVLQLSRQRLRQRRDARSTARSRTASACAGAAGVLLRRQLRRARRIRERLAGRHARDADAGLRSDNARPTPRGRCSSRGSSPARTKPSAASRPAAVFALEQRDWGALELVARYHELDIDDDAFVGGANSFANPDSAASKASA